MVGRGGGGEDTGFVAQYLYKLAGDGVQYMKTIKTSSMRYVHTYIPLISQFLLFEWVLSSFSCCEMSSFNRVASFRSSWSGLMARKLTPYTVSGCVVNALIVVLFPSP